MTVYFFFPILFLLFLFLLWFLWLGLLKLCWTEVMREDVLFLLILRKGFLLFTIECDVSCGFVINGLYYDEALSTLCPLLENFYHKWVLNFVTMLFLYLLRWSYSFYSSVFSSVVCHTDLWMLKNPCIPDINCTWLWCLILLLSCWILFAIIVLRSFVSVFISDTGLCCCC